MFLSLIGHKEKDKSDVLYIYRLLKARFFSLQAGVEYTQYS